MVTCETKTISGLAAKIVAELWNCDSNSYLALSDDAKVYRPVGLDTYIRPFSPSAQYILVTEDQKQVQEILGTHEIKFSNGMQYHGRR